MDTILKNNIEGIILKWSYQVQMVYFLSFEFSIQTDEVLGKDSAEELNKGNNPGPMTEIKFWDAKVGNHSMVKDGEFDFCCSAPTSSPSLSR